MAPHSPLAEKFLRSQSGEKFWFASPHVRDTRRTARTPGFMAKRLPALAPAGPTYLLSVALTAVLPSPNRSYDAAIRGETFFQLGEFVVWGSWRAGTKIPGGRLTASDPARSAS